MTRYDDETVITLLKDSVPSPPDLPGRVDAVRRLAGRQRQLLATQALGTVVLVVVLVASIAALGHGGKDKVGMLHPPARVVTLAEARTAMAGQSTTQVKLSTDEEETGASPGYSRMVVTGDLNLRRLTGRYHVSATMSDGNVESDYLTIGTALYQGNRPGLPPGKHWVRNLAGTDASGAADSLPYGVAHLLDDMADIRPVGTEDVGGVPTTKYVVVRTKAFNELGLEFTGAPAEEFLWLDGDGLVWRYHARGATVSGTAEGDLLLSGYGTPVEVTAPPAAEVIDESEMPVR